MESPDPTRAQKTKQSLLHAFNQLMLFTDQEKIRVADIIREADVGRSTFYDHYSGIDEVFKDALTHPMTILTQAIINEDKAQLIGLLEHFQENKQRAVASFSDAKFRDQASELLSDLFAEHLPKTTNGITDEELVTRNIAESVLALVRVWILGEVSCSIDSLADAILRTSQLLIQGLRLPVDE